MKKIKFNSKPIVCLTAYNKHSAELVDQYCDLVLVGDSLGMAYYGNSSTRCVTLNDIIRHAKSVRQGVKKSLMVVDMPFGSYNNAVSANKNAKKIIKETGCDAIKIEGGSEIENIVRSLVDNKINVMGHIGLLPQKVRSKKDFKIKGKKFSEKRKIIKDLKSIEKAGVFSVVLEAVKYDVAEEVIKESTKPIIGIGASKNCDGQILVLEDMLGFFENIPKFVKKYMNFKKNAKHAIKKFSSDVRKKKFPTKKNIYL